MILPVVVCLMTPEQYFEYNLIIFCIFAFCVLLWVFFGVLTCIIEAREKRRHQQDIIKRQEDFEDHWRKIDEQSSDLKRR